MRACETDNPGSIPGNVKFFFNFHIFLSSASLDTKLSSSITSHLVSPRFSSFHLILPLIFLSLLHVILQSKTCLQRVKCDRRHYNVYVRRFKTWSWTYFSSKTCQYPFCLQITGYALLHGLVWINSGVSNLHQVICNYCTLGGV